MRVQQQPAFVLHAAEYRETSLLLEVFSRNHGRLGLVAKGARRAGAGLRAVLVPFQPLMLNWSGRGELGTLTAAECEAAAPVLTGRKLFCGFYLNELLMRLLHRHDPHERLYEAYQAALARLESETEPEAALRIFEKHLLREIGYGLVLDREVAQNSPIMAEALYHYIPERGPLPVPVTGPDAIEVRGASLLALARERFEHPQELHEAKRLLRALLARHLGGKPLRSRELFQHLKSGLPRLGRAGQ